MTQPAVTHRTDSDEDELVNLSLDNMGELGDTTAQLDGETINVFGGIPGEEVVARVVRYRRRRRAHISAMVTEVLKPSRHRVPTPCPYFGPCSGCQWQHIDYGHQLELKRAAVQSEMIKYEALTGVDIPETLPSPQRFAYRNHARFTVRGGTLGYVNRITRRFVRVERCMLMAEGINETLGVLQGRSQETSQLSVRHGVHTNDTLVQPKLESADVLVPSGQTHYREELLGATFRIASPSFFQVNTAQAEHLAKLVQSRLRLTGKEVLVDAYAGVGVFAVLLAPAAERVIAIEESEAAVKDAEINAQGLSNVVFRQGKTEDVLGDLDATPDAVVLDPPRAGCHPDVLSAIGQLRPQRLVYVSCDPATLARDLDILVGSGYGVESVQPVDMFPQTHHVECVAALKLS